MTQTNRTITVAQRRISAPLDLASLVTALWALEVNVHASYSGSGAKSRVCLAFVSEEHLHTFLVALFPESFALMDEGQGTDGDPSKVDTFRNRVGFNGDRDDHPTFYDRHAWHYGMILGDRAVNGESPALTVTYLVDLPVRDLDETVQRLSLQNG